jgi:hypothetical protein
MTIQKIMAFILVYFITRLAIAAPCEVRSGFGGKEKVCWNPAIKGWVSESCESKKSCEAVKFFQQKIKLPSVDNPRGENPSSQYCHALQFDVLILKDNLGNEQSFCKFADSSLVDSDAIENFLSK